MTTVLIVDDDADVSYAIREMLRDEGYDTRIALSSETAADEAVELVPDVILLDLMMPIVDGFEVARRLRAHLATTSIPIIVMTAIHAAHERAEEIGAEHVLGKPFDYYDLRDSVRSVVQTGIDNLVAS